MSDLTRLPPRASLEEFTQAIERAVRSRMPRLGDEPQWERRTMQQSFEELVRELDVLSHAIDRDGPEEVGNRAAAVGMFALHIHHQARAWRARRKEGSDGGQGGRTTEGGSASEGGEAGPRAHRGEPQDRAQGPGECTGLGCKCGRGFPGLDGTAIHRG